MAVGMEELPQRVRLTVVFVHPCAVCHFPAMLPDWKLQFMLPVHVSRSSFPSFPRPDQVDWGGISVVSAERKLLAYAVMDPNNTHFALVSESCVLRSGAALRTALS